MKQRDRLFLCLLGSTGLFLLCCLCVRAFFPRVILPPMDASAILVLSLFSLVLEHYWTPDHPRTYPLLPLYGLWCFGVLPLAACLVLPMDAWKLALIGAVLCTGLTFVFDTICDRLFSGPAARAAPLLSACGLYLASQCLLGIL